MQTKSFSPQTGSVLSLIMRDPLKIYVLHRLSPIKVVAFTIQVSAGLYSISTTTATQSYSVASEAFGACRGESDLYLLNYLGSKTISKIDTQTMQLTATSASVPIFVSTGKTLDCRSTDSLMIVSEWNGNVATFDRTNLNIIKQFDWGTINHKVSGSLNDHTAPSKTYI
jgi:DNA-binding beta-propeller fold protein YncE